ncbi:MAG: MgtC/SapB family protein [Actinobacteria bacterium]|nr:MgtC/SapB family protein [Actinomycetota bacterium]
MFDLGMADVWQQSVVIFNTILAAILGSIIGFERDRAGKSAGPRTMALVASAAALVVTIGALVDINTQFGDPTRAMHAIMTGIGFLGAGLIFARKKSGVSGVTTAATVFTTAAMGCAVGLGFQLAAAGMTLVVVAILRSTQVLERTLHTNEDDDD